MSAQLKALFELQSVDLQLAKAQKARASLDDGSAQRRIVEDARKAVQESDRLLHEATAEMHDKDLNLKAVESKQKAFKDKLYGGTVTNPKELDSMEKEIEMLGRQKGKLEERILELYDIVEERKSALAAAQAVLKQHEDELARILEKRAREEESLTAQIQELTAIRQTKVSAVDPILLKRYEALSPRSAGVVVSKVVDGNCSACHTQVMGGIMRELRAGTDIQTCENCGRMLYLEE